MKLLSDDQRGLQVRGRDYKRSLSQVNLSIMQCVTARHRAATYVAVGPATVATPLFSQSLKEEGWAVRTTFHTTSNNISKLTQIYQGAQSWMLNTLWEGSAGNMSCYSVWMRSPVMHLLTRCLNSADRLPLLDSSMFITLVFVPRMLNLRDLDEGKKINNRTV